MTTTTPDRAEYEAALPTIPGLRPPFRGRRPERATIDALLDAGRHGQSGALLVHGEAGIGKTALLGYAARQAAGFRVVRATADATETDFTYAGLHGLVGRFLDRAAVLPGPQRDALLTGLGLADGPPPDRFLIAAATLNLLTEMAADRPLLVLVDDADRLDDATAQVLGFVARRLAASAVVLLVAVREPRAKPTLGSLPSLQLEGLEPADAGALLAAVLVGRLDDRVRDRILAETRGNPLAVLELSRFTRAAQLGGGFATPGAADVPARIQQEFEQRARLLPEASRLLLVVAAADGVGDAAVVLRAARALGVHEDAAEPAEAHGLLEAGGRLRFRHPLVRSAVYGAASAAQRRSAHAALAEATDADPDRRCWHRAHATAGPDEDLARELLERAEAARCRGGMAAAAAFLERAVAFTSDPAARGTRAVSAAEALLTAGDLRAAESVLAIAGATPLDLETAARREGVRGRLATADGRAGDATALLLDAARRLEPLDAELARETQLDALVAALDADRRVARADVEAAAHEVATSPIVEADPQPGRRRLALALAGLVTDGAAAASPELTEALALVGSAGPHSNRVRAAAVVAAMSVWDDAAWQQLARAQMRAARDAGALELLPAAIDQLGAVLVEAGDPARAEILVAEAPALGAAALPTLALRIAALRGDVTAAELLVRELRLRAHDRRHHRPVADADLALAMLHNGRGDYGRALEAAQRAVAADVTGVSGRALLELTEAAVRVGAEDVARTAAARLGAATPPDATPWARGAAAHAAAFVAEGDRAEQLYREALALLGRTTVAVPLARVHLTYGEWLRRAGRRRDAREQLVAAHRLFAEMGAEAFAERAAHERRATGEHVRRRSPDARDDLTAQEAHIAGLAREGRTNSEIGAQLFLSPRTVEWHLGKVFGKLGISSRSEIPARLDADAA